MKNVLTIQKIALLMLLTFGITACGKDSSDSTDPFEGNWRLVALVQGGQIVDITSNNIPCFKNSKLTVTSSDFNLFFVAPESLTPNSQCQSVTEVGTWTKRDGDYYITQNGQEAKFPIVFTDDNTTLRFTYGQGANAFDLVFKKINTTSASNNTNATKPGTGVYAGIWFIGSSRYDLAIYLRDDGTYTEGLHQNDWKTRIDGNYTIQGNKLTTTNKAGEKSYYEYHDNYSYMLADGAYFMFKVDFVNQIPPSGYKFQNIAVLDAAGNFSASGVSGYLYFDGNGKFSNDRSAFSQTSGSNIGSASYSGQKYVGTYTISNGNLTLQYANGSTSTHSFFYGKPSKKGDDATIVVDGYTYFQQS
ncbi:lipocalin family protein [Capnocytophaga sp.]|uniref:lipocalin family protein n=1 Tax=Capnocytophaga sp. TaxID=44737 RepID=UPI0026DB503E|nr:lipocalin family protein [Capnocytophaga sp.]MDO5105589.1 lipocalin family protein [Capnocytophaga sp.]